MSKIAVAGNASGSGVFTIASPNSNTDRTLTLPDTSGTLAFNPPAFRACLDSSQSVTSGTITKVAINNKTSEGFFDTNDWFDTSNYTYTPQIAGYYFFSGAVRVIGTTQNTQAVYLYKNNVQYAIGNVLPLSTNAAVFPAVSSIAYMNGTTDYMDLRAIVTASSSTSFGSNGATTTRFEGFLVRAA